ncbi:MAG TPA: hypothetical protein VGI14_22730 [Casimicrobiaceae bacterium]
MKSLRFVLGLVLAVVVATFTIRADAGSSSPDKLFGVTTSTNFLTAGSSVSAVVVFTNQTPKGGNSYINSAKLALPSGVTYVGVSSIVTKNGNTTSSGGNASFSNGVVSINGITGVRPAGTLTVTVVLSVPSNGSCTATAWTGSAWTGNSFNGDPFTPYPNADSNVAPVYAGCDGILPCGGSFTKPAELISTDPGYSSSTRSLYNKDGSTTNSGCVAVPYSYTNDLLAASNPSSHLTWLLQDTAVFTTSINFALRPAGPSGVVTATTAQVSWLPTSGGPVFIDAPACLGTNPPNNTPAPYGTLQTTLASGSDTPNITIAPSAGGVALPTSGTFPIVIGTERLTATFVSTNTYSITRGDGGTTAGPHAIGALVMSTPLPLLPSSFSPTPAQAAAGYAANMQAQMCVLEYGYQSGGVDGSGNPLVFDFGTFIDIGDGWIGQR